ncbi:hypothetical protein Hanom_Chr10g00959971 [Helianthus anomalus]
MVEPWRQKSHGYFCHFTLKTIPEISTIIHPFHRYTILNFFLHKFKKKHGEHPLIGTQISFHSKQRI